MNCSLPQTIKQLPRLVNIAKLSIAAPQPTKELFEPNIQNPTKKVYLSQSSDVFENLAFEDRLYTKANFDYKTVLFVWQNKPCVVIGRHQNPFVEVNLAHLSSLDVPLVRRNSGGGTVYHDEGNLNLTFFTSRQLYNRRWNLQVICDALKMDFNIDAKINKKDDIVVGDGLKVSGSAAKLGRLSAYHHCTLLVSTDKTQLKAALQGDKLMESNATASVPSAVGNLKDFNSKLTIEDLSASISQRYLDKSYIKGSQESRMQMSLGHTSIRPDDFWYPGVDERQRKLKSWQWMYGMTPKFCATHAMGGASVDISAYHGIIDDVTVSGDTCLQANLRAFLIGMRYDPQILLQYQAKQHTNHYSNKSLA